MILSGSSSFELKSKLKESLVGRKRLFQLSPFSFSESLRAWSPQSVSLLKSGHRLAELERRSMVKFYKEYLIWGGYPRVVLTKNPQQKIKLLADIYSSYIEKDIIGFMEIKNWIKFSRLLKLLAGQIGSLVNIAELANSTGLDRDTVERYIKILQETFVIKALLPYYKNPRQEIIKQYKVYFEDAGLRNYALENYSPIEERPDGGFLLENAVFQEIKLALRWFQKVRFWRTKQGAEIDFVIIERERDLLPIEVKLNLRRPAITLGFRSFLEKYQPSKALVVSLTLFEKTIKIGRTHISFIHPYELFNHI